MTIGRMQMNRQLYQIGGLSSLYNNSGGQKPIYPRISQIESSLFNAEQRIGDPSLGSSSGTSDGGFSSPMAGVYSQSTGGELPPIQQAIQQGPLQIPSTLINPVRDGVDISQLGSPRTGGMGPLPNNLGFIINPIREPGGMGPLPNNLGPMQGVGDPRSGAPDVPNSLQQIMRGGAANGGLMNRESYGIGSYFSPENGREKFGLGSKLKKFVRNIIPNEVADIAVKAAPFVAPFNPLLAGYMAGIGGFDQTGSIGSSLKRGLLTYGGGQLARGIGGAGFQQGFNPFSNVSFSGGIMSGLGQMFTSPVSGAPMFGQAQFAPDPNQLTPTQQAITGGTGDIDSYESIRDYQLQTRPNPVTKDLTASEMAQQAGKTLSERTATGASKSYGDIFKSLTSGNFTEMGNAAKELGGKALKDIYTTKDGSLDKSALLATLVTIPSYLDAKKAADEAGLEGFDEAAYNAERDKYMSRYQGNLPASAFGIESKADGGRIGYALGDLVRSSGVARPVSATMSAGDVSSGSFSGGSGIGGMFAKLIQNNPEVRQMFTQQLNTQPMTAQQPIAAQRFNDFIDENNDGIDDRLQAANGGRIGYGDGTKPSAEENTPSQEIIDRRIAQIKDMSKRGADIDTIKSITGASDQMIKDVLGQANGGRIGYKQGTPKEGIVSLTDEDSGVIYRDPDTEEPITKEEFLRRAQEDEDKQYMSPTDQGSGVIYRDEKGNPISKEEWLRLSSDAPSITLPEKETKGMKKYKYESDPYLLQLMRKTGEDVFFFGEPNPELNYREFDKMPMDYQNKVEDKREGLRRFYQKYDYKQAPRYERMGYAMGSEVPVRRNEGGITELDYRNTGGFVPIGVKEKADDVPAMLSKNEFVFTADAVRAAGGGSVQKGAQKMYNTMKMLEGKLV
jgi:hypothetical protein